MNDTNTCARETKLGQTIEETVFSIYRLGLDDRFFMKYSRPAQIKFKSKCFQKILDY
jgi:hypothetical protein